MGAARERRSHPNYNMLSALVGKHTGQECLLLGNGPSLVQAAKLTTPSSIHLLGTSQSWRLFPTPTYHVIVDMHHLKLPGTMQGLLLLARANRLVASPDFELGTPITLLADQPFSRDCQYGAVVSVNSVGSVLYVALQLAAWMGYARIWICGMEMASTSKFTGLPAEGMERQAALFAQTPKDIQARVRVIEPTACKTFETTAWPW